MGEPRSPNKDPTDILRATYGHPADTPQVTHRHPTDTPQTSDRHLTDTLWTPTDLHGPLHGHATDSSRAAHVSPTLGHYGHARSQGGRHPAAAMFPLFPRFTLGLL